MLQIIYKNVYCKQVASEVSDRGLEATKLLNRAHSAKSDKITCRLRRGLRFNFYVK